MSEFRLRMAPHPSPLPASGERAGPAKREGEGQVASGLGECSVAVLAVDGALRLDRWFRRHYPALGHGRLENCCAPGGYGSTSK